MHCSSWELAVEQNHVDSIVEENNSLGHDHEAKEPSVEERCELLSEVCVDVPDVNENLNGSDVSKVESEGNGNCKISSEENGAGNVKSVEKPRSQSSIAAGKTGGGTAYLRRGRRRN